MTDREAMKMALEALLNYPLTEGRAIQALHQALAQDEQTKCPRCGEVNPAEIHTCSPQVAQPEQERLSLRLDVGGGIARASAACGDQIESVAQELPKREWVGLTDEERVKCYETTGHYQTLRPQDSFAVLSLARAIEAKLKEKNT